MLDLRSVDLIIWDVDGVLYIKNMHNRDVSEIHNIFGREINKFSLEISENEGVKIIAEYFAKSPARFYENIERDFNIDRKKLEYRFHELMLDFYDYKNFNYLENKYVKKLKSIQIDNIALTQANRVWAEKILENTKVADIFKRVICSEITLDKPKSEDNNLYLDICNEMNVSPERAVIVEDSYKNLKSAKKHGLKTVYFNYDKEINEDYIDYQYRDIKDFLNQL